MQSRHPYLKIHLKILFLLFLCSANVAKDVKHIYFGAFLSNILKDELCYKAAIDTAIEMINSDPTILNGYQLNVKYLDNYGNTGFGIVNFFKIREMKERLQLLLGPFTEKNAAPVRELSYQMRLPMFEDIDEAYQSERKAIIALLKHFQWRRVSIMYDFKYLDYVKATRNLQKDLQSESIQTISVQGFSSLPRSDTSDELQHLKKKDSRIVVMNMDKWSVPTVFCDAYLQNMTFPRTIFIGGNIDGLEDNWHSILRDNMRRCTPKQVLSAAEGFFYLKRSDFRLIQAPHRAKMSRREIWKRIKSKKRKTWRESLRNPNNHQIDKPKFFKGSARIFDLVYRAALAFDKLLKENGPDEILLNEYNGDERKFLRIMNAIYNVEFSGISGNQRRIGKGHEIDQVIHQYRNGQFKVLGYYTPSSDQIVVNEHKIFPDSKVPKDGFHVKKVYSQYNLPVIIVVWIGAGFGILLSLFFLAINIYHRKKRVIKMSSPNVNNIIISGCILCYVSVVMYGVDTRILKGANQGRTICYTIAYSFSIGFTLSFGGLFSKTWRVYRVFAAARTNRRVAVRDRRLYGMLFLMVVVDVVILCGSLTVYPFQFTDVQVSKKLNQAKDIIRINVQQTCYCENNLSFLLSLIVYKIILLVFGLFMAWETRNVTIPVLNDSKHIGIAVYIVALVSTIGTISSTALSSHFYQETYVVVGLSVCLCTTSTLLLVFYPKMSLVFNKKKENHFRISVVSSSSNHEAPLSTLPSPEAL